MRVSSRAAQSNSSNVTSSQNKQSNSVGSNATGSSAVKSRNAAKSVAAAQKLSLPKKSEVSRWSLVHLSCLFAYNHMYMYVYTYGYMIKIYPLFVLSSSIVATVRHASWTGRSTRWRKAARRRRIVSRRKHRTPSGSDLGTSAATRRAATLSRVRVHYNVEICQFSA